ncbi:unnamed protein product, partial [Prorocentrum cordatum]
CFSSTWPLGTDLSTHQHARPFFFFVVVVVVVAIVVLPISARRARDPQLMIRRVGDHEAYSALRASELGDGTLEARELEDAMAYVKVYEQPGRPLLVQQNDSIVKNHSIGLYDGCKNAVEEPRLRSELLRRGAAADVRWAPHWCRQDEALHDDDAWRNELTSDRQPACPVRAWPAACPVRAHLPVPVGSSNRWTGRARGGGSGRLRARAAPQRRILKSAAVAVQ